MKSTLVSLCLLTCVCACSLETELGGKVVSRGGSPSSRETNGTSQAPEGGDGGSTGVDGRPDVSPDVDVDTHTTGGTPPGAMGFLDGSTEPLVEGATSNESTLESSSAATSGMTDSVVSTLPAPTTTTPSSCTDGFDADTGPGTRCVPWKDCAPGTYVAKAGTAIADTECAPCAKGTYTSESNATACTSCADGTYADATGAVSCKAWSSCGWRDVMTVGSRTNDVSCAQEKTLTLDHKAVAVATHPSGNVYVAAYSGTYAGSLWKYDSRGSGRKFADLGNQSRLRRIAVDEQENVYTCGDTGEEYSKGIVRSFSSTGASLNSFQPPPASELATYLEGLAVDSNGAVWVAGSTGPKYDQAQTTRDGFVFKLDSELTPLQLGTELSPYTLASDELVFAKGVAIDQRGIVYVTGTADGQVGGVGGAPAQSGPFVVQFNSSTSQPVIRKSEVPNYGFHGADALAVAADGTLYLAGFQMPHNGDYDLAAYRLDEGSTIEPITPPSSTLGFNDAFKDVVIDAPTGKVFFIGYTNDPKGVTNNIDEDTVDGDTDQPSDANAVLYELVNDGLVLRWSKNNSKAYAAAVDAHGNLYVVGSQFADGKKTGFVTQLGISSL